MLLVLTDEHKEHLGFLTRVDVAGERGTRGGCTVVASPSLTTPPCSGEGVLQDILGVYQEGHQPSCLPNCGP